MKTKNTYVVPVRKKDRTLIISDPNVHGGHLKYAIDFLLPEGTEVLAAQSGKVIYVKTNSKEGGFKKKYMGNKYLNYITIEHRDKEYSQYAHLKFKGSCVKAGQIVKAGEVIGYSGNTGYTAAPHLHFHVFRTVDSKVGWETLEIRFKEKLERIIRKDSDLNANDKKILKKMKRNKN